MVKVAKETELAFVSRLFYYLAMFENNPLIRRLVRLALEEDIGTGDVTTEGIIPESMRAVGEIVAKERGVLCGIPVVRLVLAEVDPEIKTTALVEDGELIEPGTVVIRAAGRASSLLMAERTLLNFLMHLSGIATATREFSDQLRGSKTVLLDTRKTTPGLRVLEKYACRVGGARNHRLSLASGVLIKNNHLALVDDIKAAVRDAKAKAPSLCRVEVEVRTIEQAKRAIEAGADVLLLDHMTPDEVRDVVDYAQWKVQVEVSGDVTADTAFTWGTIGVDFISSSAPVKRARWLDFSMYLKREAGDACGD